MNGKGNLTTIKLDKTLVIPLPKHETLNKDYALLRLPSGDVRLSYNGKTTNLSKVSLTKVDLQKIQSSNNYGLLSEQIASLTNKPFYSKYSDVIVHGKAFDLNKGSELYIAAYGINPKNIPSHTLTYKGKMALTGSFQNLYSNIQLDLNFATLKLNGRLEDFKSTLILSEGVPHLPVSGTVELSNGKIDKDLISAEIKGSLIGFGSILGANIDGKLTGRLFGWEAQEASGEIKLNYGLDKYYGGFITKKH